MVDPVGTQQPKQHHAGLVVVQPLHRPAQVIVVRLLTDEMQVASLVHQLVHRFPPFPQPGYALDHKLPGAGGEAHRVEKAEQDVQVGQLQRPAAQSRSGEERPGQIQELGVGHEAGRAQQLPADLDELASGSRSGVSRAGNEPGTVVPEDGAAILPAGR